MLRISLRLTMLTMLGAVLLPTGASAQTYAESVLYSFCSQPDCADGTQPHAGLVQAQDGNYYGTTETGGASGNAHGVMFRFSPSGNYTVIYDFPAGNGTFTSTYPKLIQGGDGNFYGTSIYGGDSDAGTVFRITPAGDLTILYSFCSEGGPRCTDGSNPAAGLVQGTDGNFYGTTEYDGVNQSGGTIFKITTSGALTTLYSFCNLANCADGGGPVAGLIQGSDGSFYGTTGFGGAYSVENNLDTGVVFRVTSSGEFTTLYSFCSMGAASCTDGASPTAGLTEGNDGNFYGTTQFGGGHQYGTAFKITPGGSLTKLYDFCSQDSCTDGAATSNAMFPGSDGNFYGATTDTLFRIADDGKLSTIYDGFCLETGCDNGDTPNSLLQGSDGNLYDTTYAGGANSDNGTIFKVAASPALSAPVQLSLGESSIVAGTPVTLSFSVLNAFSKTLRQCYAFIQGGAASAGDWSGLQTGTSTDNVYSGSTVITPVAAGTYIYALTCGGIESGFATLTVTVPPPSLTASPTTVSVAAPGNSASITLTVSNFSSNSITFSCSGLPSGAACKFSNLTGSGMSGTASMMVTTTASSVSTVVPADQGGTRLIYAAALPGLFAIAGLFVSRKHSLVKFFALALTVTAGFALSGCGSSGDSGGGRQPGTPSGKSSVTVTAMGGGQTAMATVILVVR